MAKKKNNLLLIIPAFMLIGTAVGVQTNEVFKQAFVGVVVGVIVYLFLLQRNKKLNNKKRNIK